MRPDPYLNHQQQNRQYCCECCLQVKSTSSSFQPWGLSMTLAQYFSSGQWITWPLPKEEEEAGQPADVPRKSGQQNAALRRLARI